MATFSEIPDSVKDQIMERLAEWFPCFVLYGFDESGKPWRLRHTDNEKDAYALRDLALRSLRNDSEPVPVLTSDNEWED